MKTLRQLLPMLLLVALASVQAADPLAKTRNLTKDEEKEVTQLQRRLTIHEIVGQFEEAVEVAKQIADYRAERQGASHWEAIDARLAVKRHQWLTGVPKMDRKEMGQALLAAGEGQQLHSQLRYREAEAKLRQALAISQKVLGEQHPQSAQRANGLGFCLTSQGKYTDALPLFQKALAVSQKALGELSPDTATCWNNVAFCLDTQGKYAEALPLFQKALAIWLQELGEQHPLIAASYTNVAGCLASQGKHAEALPLFHKALAICQNTQGEHHPDTARCYSGVAGCLSKQGQRAEALPLYQKALTICLQVLGEQHPDTAASFSMAASCLESQGHHAEAFALHQKAQAIQRKVLGEQHPHTATSYHSLAFCLDSWGKYAEALSLFRKALTIRLQVLGELHPDTATSYNCLAICLYNQGKYAEALPLFQKALAIRLQLLGERHRDTAASYGCTALCLDHLYKYAEALPLSKKALAIEIQVLGERHADTALSYNNVARCLHSQKKYAEALPLFQKALDINLLVLGEQHPHSASAYNNLASCLDRQGKYAEALPLYQKALAIRLQVLGEHHSDTTQTYINTASCLYCQGQMAKAVRYWEKALLGREVSRLQASAAGFDRSLFRAEFLSPRAALAVTMVRLKQPLQAWQHAEADLGRGLLDDLSSGPDSTDDTVTLARVGRLNQALLPLLTRPDLSAQQTEQRKALAKERDDLTAELSRTAAKRSRERVLPLDRIQKQIPPDTALVFWLDVEDTSDVINEHFGCVLRREGPPAWVVLPGSGKDSAWSDGDRSLTARTLATLADGSSDALARQQLREQLHRQRIAPLETHLKGVKQLLVVPAGQMAAVPVEALTDRYTISYVPSASIYSRRMEEHRPLQASSLLVLADPVFTRTAPVLPPAPPHGLLVKAVTPGSVAARAGLRPGDVLLEYAEQKLTKPEDLKPAAGEERVPLKLWRDGQTQQGRVPGGNLGVIVDKRPIAEALADWRKQQNELAALSRGSKDWTPLPGTRLEARTLAGLIRDTTPLLGSEASEQKLAELAAGKQLKQFRVLHLATHGEANADRPAETALILAQDKLPTPDEEAKLVLAGQKPVTGRLTVGKILADWELDADLVVLSACQTGLGKATSGEGMLGFTQALLQKGARSVVLSRWKVDDAATALLMARFYENLLGKRPGLKEPMKRAEALTEAKSWLRTVPRVEAEKQLTALVDGVPRGERGSIKAALPTRKPDEAKGEDRPFAHPYYWAAFILLGDPQ